MRSWTIFHILQHNETACTRLKKVQHVSMKQFTAVIHHGEPDEGGFWATCLEAPGANGQGETKDDCLRNLGEAVQLFVEANS
jgi:predicted RNase H-like HicB family nuclease